MRSEYINLTHVEKVFFPKQTALRDVDVSIGKGEFVFVAGASGAGKSTLLRLLFAEERATLGNVLVGGKNLSLLSRPQISRFRRSVGVIFQDYRLLQSRTILENVSFALEVVGIRKRQREQLAYTMLAAVGLKERVNAMPATLSGGEQQRVAIARALVVRPQLILADEPTGNLDPDLTRAIFELLLEANKLGATVIVASHNLPLIEEFNRRTLVFDKGRLVGDFSAPRGQ